MVCDIDQETSLGFSTLEDVVFHVASLNPGVECSYDEMISSLSALVRDGKRLIKLAGVGAYNLFLVVLKQNVQN